MGQGKAALKEEEHVKDDGEALCMQLFIITKVVRDRKQQGSEPGCCLMNSGSSQSRDRSHEAEQYAATQEMPNKRAKPDSMQVKMTLVLVDPTDQKESIVRAPKKDLSFCL